jgi:hypothetical protein
MAAATRRMGGAPAAFPPWVSASQIAGGAILQAGCWAIQLIQPLPYAGISAADK